MRLLNLISLITNFLMLLIIIYFSCFINNIAYASPVSDYCKCIDEVKSIKDNYFENKNTAEIFIKNENTKEVYLNASELNNKMMLKRTAYFDDIFRYYNRGIAKGLYGAGGRREMILIENIGEFSAETCETGFWSDQSATKKSLYTGDIQKFYSKINISEIKKLASKNKNNDDKRKNSLYLELKQQEINYYGKSSLDDNIMNYFTEIPYNFIGYSSNYIKVIKEFDFKNNLVFSVFLGKDFSKFESNFGDSIKTLILPFKNNSPILGFGFSFKPEKKSYEISGSYEKISGQTRSNFYKNGVPSLGFNQSDRRTLNYSIEYIKKLKKARKLSAYLNYYKSDVSNAGHLESGVINPIMNFTNKSYDYFIDFNQKTLSLNLFYERSLKRTISAKYGIHYSKHSYNTPFSYRRETLLGGFGPYTEKDVIFPDFKLYGLGFELTKHWRKNIDISYSLWQFVPKKQGNKTDGSGSSAGKGSNVEHSFDNFSNDPDKSAWGGSFHAITVIYKF